MSYEGGSFQSWPIRMRENLDIREQRTAAVGQVRRGSGRGRSGGTEQLVGHAERDSTNRIPCSGVMSGRSSAADRVVIMSPP